MVETKAPSEERPGEETLKIEVQEVAKGEVTVSATQKSKEAKPEENREKDDASKATDLRWKPGSGKYGMLKESQKKEQKFDQQVFVGGMKNPAEVVEGLPTLPEPWTPRAGCLGKAMQPTLSDHEGRRNLWLTGLRLGEEVGREVER